MPWSCPLSKKRRTTPPKKSSFSFQDTVSLSAETGCERAVNVRCERALRARRRRSCKHCRHRHGTTYVIDILHWCTGILAHCTTAKTTCIVRHRRHRAPATCLSTDPQLQTQQPTPQPSHNHSATPHYSTSPHSFPVQNDRTKEQEGVVKRKLSFAGTLLDNHTTFSRLIGERRLTVMRFWYSIGPTNLHFDTDESTISCY